MRGLAERPRRRHKLDVDAYYRMAEAGILREGDRVELIDGEIIDMAPIGTDHGGTVDHLTEALVMACHGRAIVRVQGPVRLDRFNEVGPDFAILRRREDYYRTAHPGPGDVLALIEVAHSSLRYDRKVKLPLYARFGIAECWIVDLKNRKADIHRQPTATGYADKGTKRSGEEVSLLLDPGVAVNLQAVFGS